MLRSLKTRIICCHSSLSSAFTITCFTFCCFILFSSIVNKATTKRIIRLESDLKLKSKFSNLIPLDQRLTHEQVGFVFDDPTTYDGPILRSWPPNRDRNVSKLIRPGQNTILTDMSCFNFTDVKILVVTQSAPEFWKRREAIRQTWQRTDNPFMKVIFLFGTNPSNPSLQSAIHLEQAKNCDIIQMDFIDDYSNCTLDSLFALKIVMEVPEINPDYLLSTDDDIYIHLPTLWGIMYEQKVFQKNPKALWGYPHHRASILRAINKTHIRTRWDLPTYLLKGNYYPTYLSGAGYVIPKNLIPCLYQSALETPFIHINDAFISGYLAKMCRLSLLPAQNFQFLSKSSVGIIRPHQVVIHGVTPSAMFRIDHIYRNQGGYIDRNCSVPYRHCLKDNTVHFCNETECNPSE